MKFHFFLKWKLWTMCKGNMTATNILSFLEFGWKIRPLRNNFKMMVSILGMFMAIHERRSDHKLCLLHCGLWRLKCIHLESYSIVASLSKKDRFPLHTKCNRSHLLSPTSTPMSIYLLWSFGESCTGSVERLLWKADLFDLNTCANFSDYCDVLTPE